MKKNYLIPSVEAIELTEKDAIMLVVSGESGNAGTGGDDDGTGEDLSNKFNYNHNDIWNDKW
jgi:hypothetical protein